MYIRQIKSIHKCTQPTQLPLCVNIYIFCLANDIQCVKYKFKKKILSHSIEGFKASHTRYRLSLACFVLVPTPTCVILN